MKKTLSIAGFLIMCCLAIALTASTQQGNSESKGKPQQENKNKSDKDKKDKNNKSKENKRADDNGYQGKAKDKDNAGQDKQKGNKNGNQKDDNDERNKDKGNKGKYKDKAYYRQVAGYRWNNENFYDRKNIRKHDKVNVCHKFSGKNDPVSINVSENAVQAHLDHGDILGECPAPVDRRFSDIYYRNRTDYYNTLQDTREQVSYSQSILDYAQLRLTNSRAQLQTMQQNNMPLADIQRSQSSVVELEQNVSLLETLIGVAVNVVANKLQ
jgi:hypothetical protein